MSTLHFTAYPPVGRWLKARRDVLGLSLSQASDRVQMSEHTLQLLESECFLELPEPAFVKGYLRRYAKQLWLDPDEVIALFDDWMQVHESQHGTTTPAAQTVPGRQRAFPQTRHFNLGSALHSQAGHAAAVILCLGLFSYFLSHGSGATSSRHADVAAATASSAVAAAHSARLAQEPKDERATTLRARPDAAPARQRGSWLIASETTHVHVTDKRGLIVFSGLVRAGRPVMLKGSHPYNLLAAKAGTVSLVHNRQSPLAHQSIARL